MIYKNGGLITQVWGTIQQRRFDSQLGQLLDDNSSFTRRQLKTVQRNTNHNSKAQEITVVIRKKNDRPKGKTRSLSSLASIILTQLVMIENISESDLVQWQNSSPDDFVKSLKRINDNFEEYYAFGHVDVESRYRIQAVFRERFRETSAIRQQVLRFLRILARDGQNLDQLLSSNMVQDVLGAGLLSEQSFEFNWESFIQAEMCLINILFNSTLARSEFNEIASNLLLNRIRLLSDTPRSSFRQRDITDIPVTVQDIATCVKSKIPEFPIKILSNEQMDLVAFYDLRIAFVASAQSKDLQLQWLRNGCEVFLKVLEQGLNFPKKLKQNSQWRSFAENTNWALKILFNIFCYSWDDSVESNAKQCMLLCSKIVTLENIDPSLEQSAIDVIAVLPLSFEWLAPKLQNVIPPLHATDVERRPDDGAELRNRMYCGFGHAAGLLANRGILNALNTPKHLSDSEASETEDYKAIEMQVNPVTGCIEPSGENPFTGMTEEQKEYEIHRLMNDINKLMNQGLITPGQIGKDGQLEPVKHVLELVKDGDAEPDKSDSENDDINEVLLLSGDDPTTLGLTSVTSLGRSFDDKDISLKLRAMRHLKDPPKINLNLNRLNSIRLGSHNIAELVHYVSFHNVEKPVWISLRPNRGILQTIIFRIECDLEMVTEVSNSLEFWKSMLNVPLSKFERLKRIANEKYGTLKAGSPFFAIDCEMCTTEIGESELTRISIVNECYEVLLDTLVKPKNKIIDYVTKYSGITEKMLENVNVRVEDVQKALSHILPNDAVLVGHTLECDFNAMRITHPYCIDISLCLNLSGKDKQRSSLKTLARIFLNEEIQGENGHCSIDDAIITMQLLKYKLSHGVNFGNVSLGWSFDDWARENGLTNSGAHVNRNKNLSPETHINQEPQRKRRCLDVYGLAINVVDHCLLLALYLIAHARETSDAFQVCAGGSEPILHFLRLNKNKSAFTPFLITSKKITQAMNSFEIYVNSNDYNSLDEFVKRVNEEIISHNIVMVDIDTKKLKVEVDGKSVVIIDNALQKMISYASWNSLIILVFSSPQESLCYITVKTQNHRAVLTDTG
ncbi:putative RNA exonuclease NEF-sp [Dirofilaria immitis]|nr:putative RNA exonuclease NEF-sp [Dirofilaria immitis]